MNKTNSVIWRVMQGKRKQRKKNQRKTKPYSPNYIQNEIIEVSKCFIHEKKKLDIN